jgi:osmoprotectant transport system permease protein
VTALLAQSRPLVDWEWIRANGPLIRDAAVEHLSLTLASVAIGLVVSLVLALAVLRMGWLEGPVMAFGGILYSIPSLAAFALLVPFFGFTSTTAVIALSTYTVLILVRNILAGIQGVDESVVEAARGQGFTEAQILGRVQLPLATPVIIAGLRVATVTVIGLVTVTALIGKGGLGGLILTGFRLLPPLPVMIVVGTVGSVVLAIAFDLALVGLQRMLTPWTRREAA